MIRLWDQQISKAFNESDKIWNLKWISSMHGFLAMSGFVKAKMGSCEGCEIANDWITFQ